MNRVILADSNNPWRNLAVEELLFDMGESGVTLYIWQNKHTVVIGRHQNAWKECRHELLESDGGYLARRTTGGGAVYHDLGNLNFTFIADKANYDLTRQLEIIIHAVSMLGVSAHFTGRNDIVTDGGSKFSGNAFRHSRTMSLHHGTLLVNADMALLSRYLMPSAEKLRSKGVDSVRARVCNLCEQNPCVNVSVLRETLIKAFAERCGAFETVPVEMLDANTLNKLQEKHASYDWRLGASPECDIKLEKRFSWGEIEIDLIVKNGIITQSRVFSDAMDEGFISMLSPMLEGSNALGRELAMRLAAVNTPESHDLSMWLASSL